MAYGQRYQDLPFEERFGDWPTDERQNAISRLIEEFQAQPPKEPGYDLVDPYGYRGERRKGFYILRGDAI